jgi:hypothetical protein
MNSNEKVTATGRLKITVTAPDGAVKEEKQVDNLVVTTGLNFIAGRMAGAGAAVMSHMAIGTGTAAALGADTALGAEAVRVALTSSVVTDNSVAYTAIYNPGTPAALTAVTEGGIFNASSAGTMLCRTVFPVVNKDVNDTLTIVWTVTIS